MALDLTTGRRRSRGRKPRVKTFVFFMFAVLTLSVCYTAANLNEKMMPTVLAMADKAARSRMNRAIDACLQKMEGQNKLRAEDFVVKTTDDAGMVNSLSVNTVLVNSLASELAADLSNEMEAGGTQTIRVPIGIMLGIEPLASWGPDYPVTVYPAGAARVDYDTSFESVGINQVNFQLWLDVSAQLRLAVPAQASDIVMNRKVTLVNTVFSGEVPRTYMNNVPPSAGIGIQPDEQ